MTVARDELLETERERVTRQFEAGGSLGLSPAEKVERLSQLRRAKVYLSLTASRRKPPRSPASHNLLKPCPSLARWSGSKRRRRKAEPSGGIVYEPADTPHNARNAPEIHGFCAAVPVVRIHLPPADESANHGFPCRPPTDRGCKGPFKEPPLTARRTSLKERRTVSAHRPFGRS